MRFFLLLVLFIVVLAADQFTKHVVISQLSLGIPVTVIPNLFDLTRIHNPGAAFGFFAGLSDDARRVALALVSAIAILVVIRMLSSARGDGLSQAAYVIILGGALGNIMDRFRYDYVVDFLDFYWKNHHWPAFNIADASICIGIVLILIRSSFKPRRGFN